MPRCTAPTEKPGWSRTCSASGFIALTVLMFVNNCAAHPHITSLEAITLQFLPPNTTSHLQPMDQGIIMNLKVNYRRLLLQHLLQSYDSGATPEQVNVKEAIEMIDLAWRNVKCDGIARCFAKAGFITGHQDPEQGPAQEQDQEQDQGPAQEQDRPDNISSHLAQHIQLPESFSQYLQSDAGIHCREEPTDEEIADSVAAERSGDVVDEEAEDEEPSTPAEDQGPRSVSECLELMQRVRHFLCSRTDMNDEIYGNAADILQYLSQAQHDKLAQRKITNFFKQ